MGQFVGEDRGDLFDGKRFFLKKLLELRCGGDFFHRQLPIAFDAGEVLEVFPDVVAAAIVEIDTIFCFDNQIVEVSFRHLRLLQFHGTLHDGLVGEGKALRLQGAMKAVGALGRAVQGAELHQGLVVETRMLAVEQLVGEVGKGRLPFININRCFDVVES